MSVVEDYIGLQGTTNDDLQILLVQLLNKMETDRKQLASLTQQVTLLSTVLEKIETVAVKLETITSILEENDARRKNRIIRQGIPARFLRDTSNR